MSELNLTEVRLRRALYVEMHSHPNAFACCSAHGSADDVPALLDEVKQLRMDIEWHRVQQVQHLDEIKQLRAQLAGGSWPPAALPQRVPGEALERECGWMPHKPMTDPALEDRTEGEQP